MVSMNDILARRQDILRRSAEHGAANVRVFGSVARGQGGPASDLDLLVRMDPSRSLLDRIALTNDLQDLLGCRVDVVNEAALHPLLRERILREARSLRPMIACI